MSISKCTPSAHAVERLTGQTPGCTWRLITRQRSSEGGRTLPGDLQCAGAGVNQGVLVSICNLGGTGWTSIHLGFGCPG